MALHNGNSLKSSSKIVKLDPFLDQDGILKVGGRTEKCDISDKVQHPILLLKSCKTDDLIMWWCHNKVTRAGQDIHHQPNKIFWFLDHKLQFIGAINDWGMC